MELIRDENFECVEDGIDPWESKITRCPLSNSGAVSYHRIQLNQGCICGIRMTNPV